jgi:hypothetical protein
VTVFEADCNPLLCHHHLTMIYGSNNNHPRGLTGFQAGISERNTVPAQQWYKSHEIRKLLGISQGTLQHLRTTGTLPFTKIGGVILYDYRDVQKMIQDHKHTRDFVFENPKSL